MIRMVQNGSEWFRMVQQHDFYIGFEGEPEYTFRHTNEQDRLVRMWGGHFDAIMAEVCAGVSRMSSLSKFHQLCEGWFNESPWVVPNVAEALSQLQSVDVSHLEGEIQKVHAALYQLFQDSLATKSGIEILYD